MSIYLSKDSTSSITELFKSSHYLSYQNVPSNMIIIPSQRKALPKKHQTSRKLRPKILSHCTVEEKMSYTPIMSFTHKTTIQNNFPSLRWSIINVFLHTMAKKPPLELYKLQMLCQGKEFPPLFKALCCFSFSSLFYSSKYVWSLYLKDWLFFSLCTTQMYLVCFFNKICYYLKKKKKDIKFTRDAT